MFYLSKKLVFHAWYGFSRKSNDVWIKGHVNFTSQNQCAWTKYEQFSVFCGIVSDVKSMIFEDLFRSL